MKSLQIALAIFMIGGVVQAQEKPIESCRPAAENQFLKFEKPSAKTETAETPSEEIASAEKTADAPTTDTETASLAKSETISRGFEPEAERFTLVRTEKEDFFKTRYADQPAVAKPIPQTGEREKFHWKPALVQSGLFLGIQHATRMYESKTRRELDGPFFRDYKNSIKNLRGWDDGGKFFTNYVAHPLQGAVTGRIFVNNSDRARRQEFGKSKAYWESRLKALAWSAVWSTQFEIGLISEASLGNVGLIPNPDGRSRLTWGDLVVTPVVGTVWVIGEDAIDKYVLKNWIESKTSRKTSTGVKIARSFLTPTTSFSNLLRGRLPWRRDNRPN